MAENNDSQAAFMEAVGSIKEYAKVNGNIVTREDVHSFFKDMALDDAKFQMISGYLMANGIKIQGEDSVDNEFLKLMESASDDNIDESGQHISKEEQEDKKVADDIVSHLDYEEDEKYLKIYLQDISGIQPMTDVTRSYLLMNIVEDNDKESLKLLTESYLEKIASWIEPFRGKGVLACDLVQEANLAMTAYIGQQEWLNNYEWKDKIKEAAQQFIERASTWFTQLPSRIGNWLSQTYNRAVQWARQLPSKAQQAGSQFVSRASAMLSQLPGRVWSYLSSCISRAISFASQFASKGLQAANNFKNRILNGLKSIPSRVVGIGRQIVQGLWNGIKGAGSWLSGQISSFANSIISGFKSSFKIHSPSQVIDDIALKLNN